MDLQFEYTFFAWLLLALVIFLLLFAAVSRWKRRVRRRMGDEAQLQQIILNYSRGLFFLKFILIYLAFACGVGAVMNLRKPSGSDGIQRKGIDVIFALDVSKSMLATDIEPSRLERAKQFISKMMDAMPDNRVGLVVFAGKAYVQMPVSADHSAAQMFVSGASPDMVPMKGTVISDALRESLRSFGEREAKYKSVILISDGEDHDEEAINASKELATHGLMVNTVGIGSPEGTFIPDDSTGGNKMDPETGQPIISKLNEQELKDIAGNTRGVYVHLTNINDAVKTVMNQLAGIDKRVTGDTSLMSYSYYFWCFTAAMLLLLILEQLLPDGRRKPAKQKQVLLS